MALHLTEKDARRLQGKPKPARRDSPPPAQATQRQKPGERPPWATHRLKTPLSGDGAGPAPGVGAWARIEADLTDGRRVGVVFLWPGTDVSECRVMWTRERIAERLEAVEEGSENG